MPESPKKKEKDEWDEYFDAVSDISKSIYEETINVIEFYVLKASASAKDFDYLMNCIEIKEVTKFVIHSFLKK